MKNLLAILDGELADGRATLEATSFDVKQAATICADNYLNGTREGKLDNTMSMATRSLGTVAFHISKLANNFLTAVNLQADIIAELSDEIDKLQMTYKIHQEKVARKSIGSCTNTKVAITYPHDNVQPEPLQKYVRRPIDFTLLETIGHGVRTAAQKPGMQYSVSVPADALNMSAFPPKNAPFARQPSTISHHHPKGEYAASVHSMGNVRYQGGTLDRSSGLHRTSIVPPQHLFDQPQYLHTGSDGAPHASPVSGGKMAYSSGMMPSPQQQYSTESAPVVGHPHSGRSSGSSSVGSSVHYATNAQLQQRQQQQNYAAQQNIFSGVPSRLVMGQPTGSIVESTQRMSQPYVPPMLVQPVPSTTGPTRNYATGQQYAMQQNPRQSNMVQQQGLMRSELPKSAPDFTDQMPLPPPDAYAEPVQGHMGMMDLSGERLIAKKPTDPPWAPDYYMEKVRTLYDYVKDKDDELTFNEEQIIYVVKKNDDGWWEGIMDGVTGLFPGNYVERIE